MGITNHNSWLYSLFSARPRLAASRFVEKARANFWNFALVLCLNWYPATVPVACVCKVLTIDNARCRQQGGGSRRVLSWNRRTTISEILRPCNVLISKVCRHRSSVRGVLNLKVGHARCSQPGGGSRRGLSWNRRAAIFEILRLCSV